MENNSDNFGQNQSFGNNQNWNTSQQAYLPDLEGANASQIMGIIGLILTFCTGCSIIGLILSIMAYVKGKNAVEKYEENPTAFSAKSYTQAKAGKIMGLIGLILALLFIFAAIVYLIAMAATGNLDN